MEIELLKDWVIIISGIVFILLVILVAFISYSLYHRVNGILKSVKYSAAKVEELTAIASEEIGKPLVQFAGLVQGIAYGVQAIGKIIKKGG